MPYIASVNVAAIAKTGDWTGTVGRTGIDKRPVTDSVHVNWDGLADDIVCDRKHHGGLDRAVYAFASGDYLYWEEELQRALPPGSFVENLTIADIDLNSARLGERWAIGTAVLEISAPRIACRVFAGFWGVPDLVRHFTERGRPGAYLRVVVEGDIKVNDRIHVVERPNMISVGDAFRAMMVDPSLLPQLAEAAEYLPTDIRVKNDRRLSKSPARK
jgi:MOSC domain-containing protein YiiM